MKVRVTLTALALGASLMATGGAAVAAKAHVHGAAKLDVAVEGAEVTLGVEMPLDSLVGFERAPRTVAERQAAGAALARLRDGAALFRFDPEANCTLGSAELAAPLLEPASTADRPARAAAQGHGDLEATYVFRCTQPARLATMEVLLFDAFKRLDRMEVQAALPQGQRKAVLRRSSRVLQLAR
jgi:hypothetical protein